MKVSQTLKALGPIDAKNIVRDPMLRWIIGFPVLIAVMVRWLTPLATARLERAFDFDLIPYYPLLMSFVPMMTPMMAGMVIGFLLLDQRDDGTMEALRVTPLTGTGYLLYRLSVPAVVSVAVGCAIFPLAGLIRLDWIAILAASVSGAPLAPFYALTLAVVARNKVEGFALSKAIGVLLAAPVLAWFVPVPWQWLLGLIPLYWPAKVLWLFNAGEPAAWLYLLAGLVCQSLVVAALIGRFRQVN